MLSVSDGRSPMARLLADFRLSDRELPSDLRLLIEGKIKEYGRLA